MKLTSIKLHRFRSFVDVDLPVEAPRILIAGLNGAGKSSIREAIRWGLTGVCEATDAKGAGYEFLIPNGVGSVAVDLDIADVGTVVRRRKNGFGTELQIGEFAGEPTVQQQSLYAKLGVSPPFLNAVLTTEHFLHLHHADAKRLVLDLLNVHVQVGEERLTLDQLESRYNQAFEERKLSKSKLRAFLLPQPPSSEEMPSLERIDAQLATLRQELETLTAKTGATAGKRQILEKLLATTTRTLETLPTVDLEALEIALADQQTLVATLEAEVDDIAEAMPTIPPPGSAERLPFLRDRIEALRQHKPTKGCVLDSRVPCDTPKVRFTKQAKALEEELDRLEAVGGAETPARDMTAHNTLREARRILQQLLADRASAQSTLNARTKSEAELGQIRSDLKALGPINSEETAGLEVLKTRIEKGTLLRKRAEMHWQTAKAYAEATARKAALEADVDRLESLCDDLGPNGLRVNALNEAIGAFTAKINAFTERFHWTVAFQVEPWGVFVNGRPLGTYSESEQFRIGIAVQLAIAELSGLSFAVIDRLDMLDLENRKATSQMIVNSALEQVFILSTREPSQALPTMAGAICYRFALENGRTMVAERTGQ